MTDKANAISLELGVKTDPIEYRYSYDWLFEIVADEGVRHLQMGTFFELYQLPDAFFVDLRGRAESHGLTWSSVFTAHRELGGFFYGEPGWEAVARRNYERLIEVAALLGAQSAGSNPGAILRDRMEEKADGTARYVRHMKELMHFAHERGVDMLAIEPMSCLAEPPTLPEEIESMARELAAYHQDNPATSGAGYCADTAHGYADADGNIVHSHLALLQPTFPYLHELHLKNTDSLFNSTFGFSEEERARGIVDIARVRRLLLDNADTIPKDHLIGYFESGGPKLGRDYSDGHLEEDLRLSLRHLKETWLCEATQAPLARSAHSLSP